MNLTGLAVLSVRMLARPAQRERVHGIWQNGVWSDAIPVTTEIKAVVQGIKDETLRSLPEGERADDFRAIWTEASLQTADDATGQQADIVIDEFGNRWRIIQDGFRVEGAFTRCVGKKTDDRGRSV